MPRNFLAKLVSLLSLVIEFIMKVSSLAFSSERLSGSLSLGFVGSSTYTMGLDGMFNGASESCSGLRSCFIWIGACVAAGGGTGLEFGTVTF
ncbi:hypothetical protein BpHYR1_013989 [Brachionus plicatilis]|uniref:Uncharacterized protein n=1 Tax=Brachionus plicatilis TaxID=10195 RepID=A0A3M7SSD3_BRAPC|nr:hypothetical protein BpHYR1_013989 [Brachionus plicatilis]